MAHTSESMSRIRKKPYHQKGLKESDRNADVIAGMLLQLFGDEDIDEIDRHRTMNKKKRGGADIYSDISDNGDKERTVKKRRYRSIDI
ncbi:hypothetical protein OROMI_019270 [Orobanche minor]